MIVALDDVAAGHGLNDGQPLANARAICPDLEVHDADPDVDLALLEAIADWCDRFTPLDARDGPYGLLLDITGCAHLFGGEAVLLDQLCAGVARQGFTVRAAIAGTPAAARVLARGRHRAIVLQGGEAAAVAALPVTLLGAEEAATRGLRRAGLKTIGEVAARASSELVVRFGEAFGALLQETLGFRDAPISPRKPAPDYVVEKRFAEPVATADAIAKTLDRLAKMLIEAMERSGKGARRMEARFFRTDGAVRTIAVETGLPVSETDVLRRLFDEKLSALADPLDPGFGFDLIRLSASRTADVAPAQQGFDTHAHEAKDVAQLIDRLAARLGSRRVLRYLPIDTHIPERADLAVPAQQQAQGQTWPERFCGEPPLRPLFLFAKPEWIEVVFAEVPDKPPKHFKWRRIEHNVMHSEGPERIAMEWWHAQGLHLPTRDYFRVENDCGLRFWLYRDGLYGEIVDDQKQPVQPRWFLHGLFA